MTTKTNVIKTQFNPNKKDENGDTVNTDSVMSDTLDAVDSLEEVIFNQDMDAKERGRLVSEYIDSIREDVTTLAKLF